MYLIPHHHPEMIPPAVYPNFCKNTEKQLHLTHETIKAQVPRAGSVFDDWTNPTQDRNIHNNIMAMFWTAVTHIA